MRARLGVFPWRFKCTLHCLLIYIAKSFKIYWGGFDLQNQQMTQISHTLGRYNIPRTIKENHHEIRGQYDSSKTVILLVTYERACQMISDGKKENCAKLLLGRCWRL